jgi:hypothetical protein
MGSQHDYPDDIIRLENPCEVGSQMWIEQMIDLVHTLQPRQARTGDAASLRESNLRMELQDLKKELVACRGEMTRMQHQLSVFEEKNQLAIAAFNEALKHLNEALAQRG